MVLISKYLFFVPDPDRVRWPDRRLCAAAARIGVSALVTVASSWRGGVGQVFTPDLFGPVERFWELLRLASVVERVRAEVVLSWQAVRGG